MLPTLFSRWLQSTLRNASRATSSSRPAVESVPPLAFAHRRAWPSRIGRWLAASGWRVAGVELPSSFGRRARRERVAAARLDFADALMDVHTDAAADALDRIAVTRSLHELWHFRAEVFSRVAQRHDQAEATRRVVLLDRHFPQRTRRALAGPGGAPIER
jgi:hypothetical protein